MDNNKVVVTGMGCVCAAGNSVDYAMHNMYEGRRNPEPPSRFRADIDKTYPVFEVKGNVEQGIIIPANGELNISELTFTNKFALAALGEAARQAKLDLNNLPELKIGVVIGTTVGCTLNNEQFYRDYKDNKLPNIEPYKKFMNSNPADLISKTYKLNGPVSCVANACSSGTDAIGQAKSWIETGVCDIVICGGADELCRVAYLGFISLLVTSDEPCRPFDVSRKGLNLGEGAGILILESEDAVKIKKSEPLAEVIGYASRADAYHPTGPHPDGKGLRGATYKALGQASLKPQDIAFVNSHGTSTVDNDRVEGCAIRDIFPKNTPVAATKSFTGHALGAAGGLEAIFTIRGLTDQKLPGTAGFTDVDPDCMIAPVSESVNIHAEIALSNSIAFGGTNSVAIFRR